MVEKLVDSAGLAPEHTQAKTLLVEDLILMKFCKIPPLSPFLGRRGIGIGITQS